MTAPPPRVTIPGLHHDDGTPVTLPHRFSAAEFPFRADVDLDMPSGRHETVVAGYGKTLEGALRTAEQYGRLGPTRIYFWDTEASVWTRYVPGATT